MNHARNKLPRSAGTQRTTEQSLPENGLIPERMRRTGTTETIAKRGIGRCLLMVDSVAGSGQVPVDSVDGLRVEFSYERL